MFCILKINIAYNADKREEGLRAAHATTAINTIALAV